MWLEPCLTDERQWNMNEDKSAIGLMVQEDVAYVTLDAPPYNILTCRMMDELSRAVESVAANESVKALAITARGKAFSAGADVGEHTPEKAPALIDAFGRLFRALAALDLPIVMAVDGAALGGGFELVLMADTLLASDRSKFGQPEIRLGFFAPVGVCRLPALVGPAKATEIICSGRTYSAEEMHRYGVVTQVVPSDELSAAVESTLADYRHASPLIMRMNVSMLRRVSGHSFVEALGLAERAFLEELMVTEDVREGIASFFEKRAPRWRNR
jgi:cyclohexa-1,5-dienecarbonyl-CoA hydratase